MPYDGELAAEGFRRQAQLAAALYRSNLQNLGKSTDSFTAHHEIVALWSVYAYLAEQPAFATRREMLKELRRLRAGARPDGLRAPIFREDWYAGHRDRLLGLLVKGFKARR